MTTPAHLSPQQADTLPTRPSLDLRRRTRTQRCGSFAQTLSPSPLVSTHSDQTQAEMCRRAWHSRDRGLSHPAKSGTASCSACGTVWFALGSKRCDLSHWPAASSNPQRAACHACAEEAASTTWQSHGTPRDPLVGAAPCDWSATGCGQIVRSDHPGAGQAPCRAAAVFVLVIAAEGGVAE